MSSGAYRGYGATQGLFAVESAVNELAAALGIDQRVYSTYETGRREIPAHHAVALADFYKTSTDYLFGRTDQSKPYPRK